MDRPQDNDGVELFLDGDRLGGDLKDGQGSQEGFQAASTATGRKYAVGVGTEVYDAKTTRFQGGYVVEFRIPLSTIDVEDGAGVTPAGPGSTLRFNLGIVDHDQRGGGQNRYYVLWSEDRTKSPYFQGDGAWPVDLYLSRAVRYALLSGPEGAALVPVTGILTWMTPKAPRTEKITVRARDVAQPGQAAEVSFSITTTTGTPPQVVNFSRPASRTSLPSPRPSSPRASSVSPKPK
jgi:hypothetical protein